ncbi:hypothetical protein PMAYCL1PPCAC_06801, partial [Pristionchus mayeri]
SSSSSSSSNLFLQYVLSLSFLSSNRRQVVLVSVTDPLSVHLDIHASLLIAVVHRVNVLLPTLSSMRSTAVLWRVPPPPPVPPLLSVSLPRLSLNTSAAPLSIVLPLAPFLLIDSNSVTPPQIVPLAVNASQVNPHEPESAARPIY